MLQGTVERVSVGGIVVGKAKLLSGRTVPLVRPELRCMYSWSTAALVDRVYALQDKTDRPSKVGERNRERTQAAVASFLERIYQEGNRGWEPEERALNAAVTNALNAAHVFEAALAEGLELEAVDVAPSLASTPEAECFDVKLTFFAPTELLARARKIYRFTFSVSEPCPVPVGRIRSWSIR
jgi:cyclic patellamide precursor peptide PatG